MSLFDYFKPGRFFAGQLQQLWIDTFVQAYDGVHSPEDIRHYCDQHFSLSAAEAVLSDGDTICQIALRNQKPVGFSILVYKTCPVILSGKSCELKQVYVLAEEYGSGLGKKLLTNVVNEAVESHNQWLWLCVSDLNFRAQEFYKKTGFELVGKGPEIAVGSDRLSSSVLALKL